MFVALRSIVVCAFHALLVKRNYTCTYTYVNELSIFYNSELSILIKEFVLQYQYLIAVNGSILSIFIRALPRDCHGTAKQPYLAMT